LRSLFDSWGSFPKWLTGFLQGWGFFAWLCPIPSRCRDPSLPWGQIRDSSMPWSGCCSVTSASLVKVSLQVGTCLRWGAHTGLHSITIEGDVVKDGLCWEAPLKVVLTNSKVGDGASLGAPDLARCLSLVCLLCFRFLIAFLVSCLSVLGESLLALSRSAVVPLNLIVETW